jgi:phage terminase large subunit
MFRKTTALKKIRQLNKRIKVVQGGTSAGKTIAILLYLIDKAQREKLSISIVSESYPHLKRGAMRDFFNILTAHNYYNENLHNKTDSIYNFETKSFIEFFGADQPDKVRGPRRDILFINEANNVPYGVYDQLEVRTKDEVIIDYNPTNEFWVHEHVIPHTEHDFIKLTYKDNESLDDQIVKSIESRKHNENWWKVYGLGELGTKEGQIYDQWNIIDNIPKEARLERYGMDFGYTQDPTAIVAIYKYNDGYILDEIEYKKGLSNKQIADILNSKERALTIADSAEPKSIDEIKSYGVKISGSMKGQGSVNYGIQLVQDQNISITKRSVNIIKEYRNYMWKTDRQGKSLNQPAHEWSHGMDAIRYGLSDLIQIKKPLNILF